MGGEEKAGVPGQNPHRHREKNVQLTVVKENMVTYSGNKMKAWLQW